MFNVLNKTQKRNSLTYIIGGLILKNESDITIRTITPHPVDVKRNCYMCSLFECADRYDYDFDAVFNGKKVKPLIQKDGECFCGYDKHNGTLIDNFDREEEHECCVLDPMIVALYDKELQKTKTLNELKEMFERKYE